MPTTDIEIDLDSPTPVWQQIYDSIAGSAASGKLPAEHRLPPVRTLAADLGIAPGTVAKVYRELEAAGIIETRGRHGTFVTAGARQAKDDAERQAILIEGAAAYARAVRQAGATPAEARAALAQALADI